MPRSSSAEVQGMTPVSKKTRKPNYRDYMKELMKYNDEVLTGKYNYPTCHSIVLANKKLQYELDMSTNKRYKFPYFFDEKKFFHACKFVESFPVTAGSARTWNLHLPGEYLLYMAYAYGWRWKDIPENLRIKDLFVEVGRGSGKSTLTAAMCLYSAIHINRPGEITFIGANTEVQAREGLFRMIRAASQTPEFLRMVKGTHAIENQTKKVLIHDLRNPSSLPTEIVSLYGQSSSVEGKPFRDAILDEIHSFKNNNIYKLLAYGRQKMGAPVQIKQITSGGVNKDGPAYKWVVEGRNLLQGKRPKGVSDTEMMLLFELDEGDDPWQNFDLVHKTLPLLKQMPYAEHQLREDMEKAERDADLMREMMAKVFNVWEFGVGQWLTKEQIDKCIDNTKPFDWIRDECSYLHLGFDLSQTKDFSAVTILGVKGNDISKVYMATKLKIPRPVAEKNAEEHRDWKTIVLTDPDVHLVDRNRILASDWYEELKPVVMKYGFQRMCFDNYFVFGELQHMFQQLGLRDKIFIRNYRGNLSSRLINDFESRLDDGVFSIAAGPTVKWMMQNAQLEHNKNAYVVAKPDKDSYRKVDAVSSMLAAQDAWDSDPAFEAKYQFKRREPYV